ncbi:MAG: glycoside hydrolase family 3 protein [Bauldia sp.]|uniref:glycoside hydrolase family 3 N-terminal domain-containing protein n=1 Tax=Bauldia sp. TaxID=2575872 RepID=UPI001DDF5B77|nr:glycoside hydrolase family 3 N-terminal domain-containing protein [Bauldia sp.]MCB1496501.1 glycoside hydrolase family 3 protein [Bauldia sp.]
MSGSRRRYRGTAWALAWALVFVAGPAHAGAPSPRHSLLEPPPGVVVEGSHPDRLHPDRRMELIARKIGQMIIVGFPGTEPGQPWPSRVAAMIADGRIGGVILFGHNVRNPQQVRRLTGAMRAAGGGLTPFVTADQEGGYIQRFKRRQGFKGLPSSARTISQKGLCNAWSVYLDAARELASLGINVNFGPVVDLNVNPRSPAIGRLRRSYGVDPATVAGFALQFIGAHAAAGVLAVAKHFPGHGSALLDPHKRVVDVTGTWRPEELEVFRDLIRDNAVPMIMVGHLIHPRFSDGDRPASLSRRAITLELRQRLGFKGLIVTDDLGMDAITDRYGLEEAAVMAVRAGADVLIFANQRAGDNTLVDRVIARVSGAVAAGAVPESTLDRSYRRILAAKRKLAAPPSGMAVPGLADAVTQLCAIRRLAGYLD